jgi:hypothetical protein
MFVAFQVLKHFLNTDHNIKEIKMKRWITILFLVFFLGANLAPAIAGNSDQANGPEQDGPAPNSGDGVPDGSGFGTDDNPHPGDDEPGAGPAPNSGDGVPDGSGF